MARPDDLVLDAALVVAPADPEVAVLAPIRVPRVRNLPILDAAVDAPPDELHSVATSHLTFDVVVDAPSVILEVRVHREGRLNRPALEDHFLDVPLARGCDRFPAVGVLVRGEVAVLGGSASVTSFRASRRTRRWATWLALRRVWVIALRTMMVAVRQGEVGAQAFAEGPRSLVLTARHCTMPLMKVHGVSIMPPSQPSDSAQKHTSSADKGSMMEAFVLMHMRSEAASAPANAQQQPQLDWSRMSPITLAHCGQFSAESKFSGIFSSAPASKSVKRCTSPRATAAFKASFQPGFTPHKDLEAPGDALQSEDAPQPPPQDARSVFDAFDLFAALLVDRGAAGRGAGQDGGQDEGRARRHGTLKMNCGRDAILRFA
eukprot:CAMPEP_0117504610 /NCGR_PEP_ID=MMETSP0784-20121206/24937_1 /TAXON_ID=39447 /ORGANISM="" /LENGTH=374 /DNA_ID=CAMNT_0005299969 /DNA_START=173 /DNA_END=1295 /DNA_ORIENTATION=-